MSSLFQTADKGSSRPQTGSDNPLLLILRHWRLFIVVFALVLLATIAALKLLPPRYYASGSLIVAEPESGLSLPPAGWAQKVGDPADLESQLLVVRSPRVLRQVLSSPEIVETIRKECEADRNPIMALFMQMECDDLTADNPASIDYLLSHYKVGGAGRSRVITVGYTSSDPTTAQTMANALINASLQDHREGISDGREVAMRGLAEEIERLDGQIRSDDQKIQAFRAQKGLTNGATAPITSERLSSINTQLALAEASRSEAAGIIAAVRDGGTGAAATLPAVLENRAVADVKQRLAAAEEQAGAAAIALGPRHPRLQAYQSQVQTLRVSLEREVGNVINSARKQFDAAQRTVTSLKGELQSAKEAVSAAMQDEASIEQMVRDLGIKRNQYTQLVDQRKGLESEQKALLGSTRLVNLAEYPDRKFFPKTTPFIAGGLALGLILASASAVLWGRLRGSGSESDVLRLPSNQSSLPRLPFIRGSAKGAAGMMDLLAQAGDTPAMQQALASILSRLGDNRRSVVVLSAFAEEGKTFTTMSLARLAARSGKQVLVVEADMRKPILARLLGIEDKAGFADILAGAVAPREAVHKTETSNLDVIAAGDVGEATTEQIISERLDEFLAWASAYDLVLIDGPALDRQMDAGLLACRADGFIFCVSGGDDQIPAMLPISQRLTNLGAVSLGFVLTPVHDENGQGQGLIDRFRTTVGGR